MEKVKFGNLTTNQLLKRKKYALILIAILIAAVVLDVSALIYLLVIGKGFHNALFITAAACIIICMPIYIGKKNIEGELKNREGN